ncbi:hypothetical protein H9L13_00585 [Sphingomonas lutea]|uniref:DUF5801 domain-containing protein n=1 Tax=Sphingomonas lutea TaxID=1045317 RepID=A0A7G9SI26_9SPHN|nr:DUF5801 repeats-in-toxin domain-containing protein [Sphingomonas lutea]QNN67501.1 hypothetical protein H9L13_00585 [Sphingomonas lutea]
MDYQDTSSPTATDTTGTGASPVARPDVDALAPGSFGPATGNTISGAGTITGTTGADSAGNGPAAVVSVQGAGGSASTSAGSAQVPGQYGVLSIDAQGNFSYTRNGGTPDGVEDVFGYTLADRDGSTSASTLTIQIGQTQTAALDGVVNLPAGVELSDIRVQGRDLVVTLPDGSTMVIPGGAVFVPQLVIGDTQVPASNVAALLINSEPPAPAAGSLQSSGGNFANPVPPLDPGVPLGDLIPPTELFFPQPDFEEIGQDIDEEPEAGVTSAEVDDDEQSGGNPGGVGDDPFGSTDSGFLPGSDGDGSLQWALLTAGAPTGFSYSAGPNGSILVFQNGNPNAVLSITVNSATGAYTVTQLGAIAHAAGSDENNLTLPISYSVTDDDGDTAIGTLNVNVDDDTPIARNDTDALAAGQKSTDGNVVTAVGTTSAPGSADSPGADGLGSPATATDGVNGILAGTSGAFTAVPTGGVTINGQFGSLLINQNGGYVYTRFENSRQGGTDVFTYRIFDGDGDETTATLTITVPADPIPVPAAATAIVDDDGLVGGDQDDGDGDDVVPNNDGDNNQATFRGTLSANFSTDVPGSFNLAAMNNQTATVGQETVRYSWNAVNGVLTATIEGGARNGLVLFTVDIDVTPDASSDQFTVTLVRNVLHLDQAADTENNATAVLTFTAVDSNNDAVNNTLTITFDDDVPLPIANAPAVTGRVDEDALVPDGNNDSATGDDPGTTTASGLAGSLTALFNPGADLPLKILFTGSTSSLTAQGLTSNGKALLYTVNVATGVLTAVADLNGNGSIDGGETEVFTLTVNPDGSWTFLLKDQLDHDPVAGKNTEDNILIDFSGVIVAEDSDGDRAGLGANKFVVDVDDDLPVAAPEPRQIKGLVDEDNLPTGNDDLAPGDDDPGNLDGDGDGTTTGGNGTNLNTLFDGGADQPIKILLSTNVSGLVSQGLTSKGAALAYNVNVDTGVLTGYVESGATAGFQAGQDRVVFTLTANQNGTWKFDLADQLDHNRVDGADTEDNLLIDFSSVILAVDADGDTASLPANLFVIDVDDDMPKSFGEICPDDVEVTNAAGASDSGSLNLPPVGADEPGVASFDVSNGDPVLDSAGKQLSSDGNLLFYFVNGNVLEARETNAAGDVVFRITLNPNGTYLYEQIEDISSTTTLSITNLSSVGGGNVDAKGINVPDSPFDLILTTAAGESVNTNATEIGISDGNSFKNGEVLRIDLVQNVFQSGSGGSEVLNFGEYYTANAFRQDVSGLAGGQRANFIIRAVDVNEAAGSVPGDPADGDDVFFGDGNDTFLTGTTLNIYNDAGVLVSPASYAGLGITVTSVVTGWQVTGLPNNYDYEIVSATPFNAVQIEATTGTGTFKLGFIDITSTIQTDVAFSVPIKFTDFDNDSVYCDIHVDLGAPSNTPNVTILVDEAALNSVGSNPGSPNETQGGSLAGLVTGGVGPYTFALVGGGTSPYGTLTLNPDGTYSFTLTAPFDSQPDANDGINVEPGVVVFTYEATDSTGAKSQGTITVNVRDDVPNTELSQANPTITLDESDASTDSTGGVLPNGVASLQVDFSPAFTTIFGADGNGGDDYALILSAEGIGSGLFALNPLDVDPAGVSGRARRSCSIRTARPLRVASARRNISASRSTAMARSRSRN